MFQFHKGTIKPDGGLAVDDGVGRFNSIKVRLNPVYRDATIRRNRVFQFHKGTIKPKNKKQRRCRNPLFQFHKGTIKPSKSLP